MDKLSIYVHIPFCNKICSYCVFPKVLYMDQFIDPYLDSLDNEIEQFIKNNGDDFKINSIYLGGGTPLSLNVEQLKKLFHILDKHFCLKSLNDDVELSIETNVDNVNLEKVKLLKEFKFNRISIGIQSFDETIKKYLNRNHDFEQAKDAVSLLKDNGLKNINLDLLFGSKKHTKSILLSDLKKYLCLGVTHISVYPLEIERGCLLFNNKDKIDSDKQFNQFKFIKSFLEKNNFVQYEVSNFSLNNEYKSKHNLTYWYLNDYVGFGLGSYSFLNNRMINNTKSLTSYNLKDYKKEEEIFSEDDIEELFVMQNLRLNDGLDLNLYQQKFNVSFLEKYKKYLSKNREYFKFNNDKIIIKDKYIYVLNSILVDMFLSKKGKKDGINKRNL